MCASITTDGRVRVRYTVKKRIILILYIFHIIILYYINYINTKKLTKLEKSVPILGLNQTFEVTF